MIKILIREPLVHFLLVGASLFLLYQIMQTPDGNTPNRIVISPGQMERMQAQFKRTWIREPTQEDTDRLIKGYVRDEVYYREALALGLDQNDPQVRQRMRMKLEFLLQDLNAEDPPSDTVLNTFLQQNPERFFIQPRVSLQQVYLSPDKRKDFDADAQRILKQLQQGISAETLGDVSMLPFELSKAPQHQVRQTFGEVFASEVVKLPVGDWSGPIYSNMGVHLVKVTAQEAGYLPDLEQVRQQVERDYLAQRRQQLKDKAYTKLREGYEVVIEEAVAQKETDAKFTGEAVAAMQAGEAGQK